MCLLTCQTNLKQINDFQNFAAAPLPLTAELKGNKSKQFRENKGGSSSPIYSDVGNKMFNNSISLKVQGCARLGSASVNHQSH